MATPQVATQKPNLDSCARKLQKICWKTFKINTYSFDYVNLSTIFCT